MLRIRSTIAHSVLYESSAPCMESQVPHYPDGERREKETSPIREKYSDSRISQVRWRKKKEVFYTLCAYTYDGVLNSGTSVDEQEDFVFSQFDHVWSSEFGTSGTSRPRIPSITRASKQYRECCCGIPKHIPIIRTT
ncbi:hypothetical protein V1477_003737 [Vespula maculifrons]|uniref:Uncharacterized protein n=2 Tax=Vespula TaxID=7451 RepID=A0A834KMF3_VESVU|nr:hypothetical protein HZH66_002998 [Vespula vulgaris]